MLELRCKGGIRLLVLVAILCSLHGFARAEEPGVGRTPPMGWNSWNHFACKVSDAMVRAQADALVSTGMKAAGYVYVNIDDCWQGTRDPQGNIQPNEKFPDMKALGDYIHSKGLKFGIYSSPGPKTCAGYEGSLGHEEQDARTYASWGVDYLKYDKCSLTGDVNDQIAAYTKMHEALHRTGRPIFYSLCQYGLDRVWSWGPSVAATLGAPRAILKTSMPRWRLSGLARTAWNDSRDPATGTTRTCSRSGMAG
jgi:alpha-galactosidase